MVWVGWLIMLSLPLYALVQLVLLHRIGERVEADDPLPIDGYRAIDDTATTRPDPGTCRRCGAANDPAYSFCRGCVARLAG